MDRQQIETLARRPLAELMDLAHKTRQEALGSTLELCSIINAKSGLCGEDCKFCAQSSRHRTDVATYPLKSKKELVEGAKNAKAIGAKKFGIVTSGNRLNSQELETIAQAITEITQRVGIDICASLGALTKEELTRLKEAGLSRYHHNIETSPRHYPKVVSTHSIQERIQTIQRAKEAGLETCSGGILGMGETWEDRIEMALLLKELDVDSVPLNCLVPVKGTPFASLPGIDGQEAIKTICLFRLILKDKTIKMAAGRETVLKDFQTMGFMAGANGMLIGGYLTIQGRSPEEDHRLIAEVKRLWTE